MQPQLLLVKLHRISGIAKKKRILNQDNPIWSRYQAGVLGKQLMWKDDQCDTHSPDLACKPIAARDRLLS